MQVENTDFVWITNSRPRIIHLPDRVKRVKGEQGHMASIGMGDGKPIPPSAPREKDGKPQATAVDRAYWDRVKDNAQVQVWLRLGWLSVSDQHAAGEGEIDSLMKFNAKTAETIVGGEDNPALLMMWAKNESRPEVQAAIATRLEQVGTVKGKGKLPPLPTTK